MALSERTTTSLINCLRGAERKYQKAVNISNESFRTFNNISIVIRHLESNKNVEFLLPFQLWLQSFLLLLRDNTRYHRETRNQLRDWVRFRQALGLGSSIRGVRQGGPV